MVGVVPEPNLSIYNASKAALIQFYKTLRVELGSEVKITTVNPGAMESELIKGKTLLKEAEMGVDEVGREVIRGPMPMKFGKSAAARMEDEACTGASYVVTPPWVRVTGIAMIVAPELLESIFSYVYRTGPGNDRRYTLQKAIENMYFKMFL